MSASQHQPANQAHPGGSGSSRGATRNQPNQPQNPQPFSGSSGTSGSASRNRPGNQPQQRTPSQQQWLQQLPPSQQHQWQGWTRSQQQQWFNQQNAAAPRATSVASGSGGRQVSIPGTTAAAVPTERRKRWNSWAEHKGPIKGLARRPGERNPYRYGFQISDTQLIHANVVFSEKLPPLSESARRRVRRKKWNREKLGEMLERLKIWKK